MNVRDKIAESCRRLRAGFGSPDMPVKPVAVQVDRENLPIRAIAAPLAERCRDRFRLVLSALLEGRPRLIF